MALVELALVVLFLVLELIPPPALFLVGLQEQGPQLQPNQLLRQLLKPSTEPLLGLELVFQDLGLEPVSLDLELEPVSLDLGLELVSLDLGLEQYPDPWPQRKQLNMELVASEFLEVLVELVFLVV